MVVNAAVVPLVDSVVGAVGTTRSVSVERVVRPCV